MKKKLLIFGVVALATALFFTNNRIQDDKSINLDSLISLNTANAEEPSGHPCYDSFVLGSTYISINCSGCRAQRNDMFWDGNTCS